MTTHYVIGIDIGGSSTKSAIHAADGRFIASASASYAPTQPAPGVVEYAPGDLTEAAERSIRDALTTGGVDPRDVVAVTCDAMISGTIGIGEDGSPTTPYTTTLDTRFGSALNRMLADADAVRALSGTGTPVVAAKIAWYREEFPNFFARTRRFVLAGGFIGGHLAGLGAQDAFIDPTVLWAVGLSDTQTASWSADLLNLLDIPADLMPRIVPSTTVVGGIAPDVARRTGLRAGTPVVAGCGDQMAGFLGAGGLQPGVIGDSSGTYEVVGRQVSEFAPDPLGRFDVIPSALGEGYVQQSVVAIGGGFTWAWLCANVLHIADNDPDAADRLASEAPAGCSGLVFVPHFGGQGSPSRPEVRGSWLGLGWEHGRSHLARSFMEAIAFEVGAATTAFGPAHEGQRIVGYGGGARSGVAAHIRADVTGLPVHSLGDLAPAPLAAALLGGVAVGAVSDFHDTVRQTLPTPRITLPDPESHRSYSAAASRYAEALRAAALFAATGG